MQQLRQVRLGHFYAIKGGISFYQRENRSTHTHTAFLARENKLEPEKQGVSSKFVAAGKENSLKGFT